MQARLPLQHKGDPEGQVTSPPEQKAVCVPQVGVPPSQKATPGAQEALWRQIGVDPLQKGDPVAQEGDPELH